MRLIIGTFGVRCGLYVFLLWQTGLNLACLVAFDLLQASPAQQASLCSDLALGSTLQDYVLM